MLRLSGRTQKYIVYGVELFLVYIIQFTPSLLPRLFGESPMLLTVCAVSIAVFEGDIIGMWFGMAAGLLLDLGSTAPFGFYALVNLALCYGVGLLVMYLMRNNIVTSVILGFAAVLLVSVVQWFFLSGSRDILYFIPNILLPRTVYSTVTVPAFYYFNRAITTRLYDD
ncbi:MAG: rod shape-determining protein MreD [Clostridia bacterium]|nr:rod shape-determining protein MreD [Clostridia bacterium]